MPMASTFETVACIISSSSDVPLERITPQSHVKEDLGVDSLAFLDIAFEIDQTFGIKLPVEDWIARVNEGKDKDEDYFIVGNLCAQIESLRVAAAE
jgi:acyl carrier protein